MPTANERQHGGDHYKKFAYEHWDWACDSEQHYLVACATKYASRWRDKGGKVDLEKMIHYLDKAEERGISAPATCQGLTQFTLQIEHSHDAMLVSYIACGDWQAARKLARWLIENEA